MADLPTALNAALTDHYSVRGDFASPVESRRGFQARVRALERAYGTKRAAAEAAGVSKDTWSRWATGKQKVSARSAAKVGDAHMALLRAAKVARKGYPSQINITAIVACLSVTPGAKRKSLRYNSGNPHRKFNADRMTATQVRDVVGAWAAGRSPDYVAQLLLDKIADAYGAQFAFEGTDVEVEILG